MHLDVISGCFPERETDLRKERGGKFQTPVESAGSRNCPRGSQFESLCAWNKSGQRSSSRQGNTKGAKEKAWVTWLQEGNVFRAGTIQQRPQPSSTPQTYGVPPVFPSKDPRDLCRPRGHYARDGPRLRGGPVH